jgi:hypothetical protein
MGVSPPTAGIGGNWEAGTGCCEKDWGEVRGRLVLLYCQYAAASTDKPGDLHFIKQKLSFHVHYPLCTAMLHT